MVFKYKSEIFELNNKIKEEKLASTKALQDAKFSNLVKDMLHIKYTIIHIR
jgi:hypothetical protein